MSLIWIKQKNKLTKMCFKEELNIIPLITVCQNLFFYVKLQLYKSTTREINFRS
jgi:hypothetical protein